MLEQRFDCITGSATDTRPVHAVRPGGLAAFLQTLAPAAAAFLRDADFSAKAGELALLPGPDGVAAAVLGLGTDSAPFAFGVLPARLPQAGAWRLEPGDYDPAAATLGYLLGAYRYDRFRSSAARSVATLLVPSGHEASLSQAAATWMVRDLINTPANCLGPVELADFAVSLAQRHGARHAVSAGEALEEAYPTVAAVGRGAARPPRVVVFHWQGREATDESPLVSLCGKGVCFDTGGYDLKPSAAMLRMKKDMGGAATVLGLARLVMEADLPIRLAVRVGCVENAVSGTAMRPSDILHTRSGLTVEVGNTDAEGRLVLCDLLDEACEEEPALLVDCATLTGAARVALGPDLPALFCNDDSLAEAALRLGNVVHDPLWRLPLWSGYNDWLKSTVADVNNVASKPMAGAIVAGLYLQRFVRPGTPWMHVDLYAWNDQSQPGRPEGGEAMAMRALFALIQERFPQRVAK
ncbi:leucyl aminopeptidase family protein [Rhodopila globiformis]|uniref:Leucyl aminopeptidase n=1 Tax=Rhodopila globiformis TaxID=1071 RepID=A0A2S6N0J2_RHOGL|nr:leucyl aminopeptidase family protein [Rhodopila globiformis]PPQ28134.1 leucyl aminopeptidase [Rhodopila globiformis]